MQKDLNKDIANYKKQIANGDIPKTYKFLLNYLMKVKSSFEKTYKDNYSCGNISPGYMDISYFPFSDDYLQKNKLRFGIVFNHNKVQFELWLMGRNAKIQKNYWDLLKSTKWNKNQTAMPQYSVLEAVLVENPNFNNTTKLIAQINKTANDFAIEIMQYLKSNPI